MNAPDGLLSNPAFRKVWLAGLCGGVVRWFEIVVIGIYVFQVTQSAFQASLIAMLRILPFAPAGPLLGMLAERFGLRRTYLALVVLMFAASMVQMLLAIAGWIEVWHLAVGALLAGVYWAAELPLRRTLLGSTVPPERLVPAMALDTTTNNLTKMMGPLLGGIVLQLVGLAGTFGFAVLMQAITFTLVRQIEAGKRAPRRHAGFLRNLREGLAMARHNPIVLLALGHSLVFNLFGFPGTSMIPVIGEDRLELSAAMIGLLTAAEGIGAAVGSLLVVRFGVRIRYHCRFFAFGILFFLLMMAAFSLATSAALAGMSLLGAGLGMACFSTMQSTLVLMSSPEAARSRLMGLMSVFIGAGPLGFLLLGWTAEHLGAAWALRLMVIEGLIAWAAVCWWLRDVLTRPTSDHLAR